MLEAIDIYTEVKGEIVIVIDECREDIDYDEMLKEVYKKIEKGCSSKDAIKMVSKEFEVSKNILYNKYEESKK